MRAGRLGGLIIGLGWAVSGLGLAVGCDGYRAPTPPLAQAKIPSDFNFVTTRGITLEARMAEALAENGPMALEIRRQAGDVIFRGGLAPDRPVKVDLLVPTGDRVVTLVGTCVDQGVTREIHVQADITSGRAQIELQ